MFMFFDWLEMWYYKIKDCFTRCSKEYHDEHEDLVK